MVGMLSSSRYLKSFCKFESSFVLEFTTPCLNLLSLCGGDIPRVLGSFYSQYTFARFSSTRLDRIYDLQFQFPESRRDIVKGPLKFKKLRTKESFGRLAKLVSALSLGKIAESMLIRTLWYWKAVQVWIMWFPSVSFTAEAIPNRNTKTTRDKSKVFWTFFWKQISSLAWVVFVFVLRKIGLWSLTCANQCFVLQQGKFSERLLWRESYSVNLGPNISFGTEK